MTDVTPTALLVEDDSAIRCFMRAALEQDGWQVREATTLARARADTCAFIPDLIVLDLGMPDGDGVDFIGQLRQRSEVPIIVMAARVEETEKTRALTAGANEYLTKLFGIGERLTAALHRLRPRPPHQPGANP